MINNLFDTYLLCGSKFLLLKNFLNFIKVFLFEKTIPVLQHPLVCISLRIINEFLTDKIFGAIPKVYILYGFYKLKIY